MRVLSVVIPEPPVPKQVPDGIWKQPDDNAIPFAKVEVAVEEELRPPFSIVSPETLNLPAIVEEAVEKKFVEVAVPVAFKFATERFPEINALP